MFLSEVRLGYKLLSKLTILTMTYCIPADLRSKKRFMFELH